MYQNNTRLINVVCGIYITYFYLNSVFHIAKAIFLYDIGQQMPALRKKKGLSQADLGKAGKAGLFVIL